MPIKKALLGFYPIDWQELSQAIRFGRAKGRCEQCRRPHGQTISHLGDGRWFDPWADVWRNGHGREIDWIDFFQYRGQLRQTLIVLATAHLDHDPTNNTPRNLKALCQRCHLSHDRVEHRKQARITIRQRRAMGDLFDGPYRRW